MLDKTQPLEKRAVLYRMVMEKHTCPYGIKVKYLLEREGYVVEDHHLTTREATDAFKAEHGVKTTPQVFIDGKRIGGHDDTRRFLGKKVFDPLTGTPVTEEACDQLTIVPGTGKQTEAEFDETVKNLVTFLAYSANPVKLESQRIGTYVLLFLAFFFVVSYLLKREYWKDVH